MQVMLSFESLLMASRQTRRAAWPPFWPSFKVLATSSTTSEFEKLPSDTPSQTKSTKSVSSHSKWNCSGIQVTGRLSGPGPPVRFSSRSPNPRHTERLPLTRSFWTSAPAASMRFLSSGSSGLWSRVKPLSVPPPSKMLPSALPRITLLSPALTTWSLCFSPAAFGFRTTHMVAVVPLSMVESKNSWSILTKSFSQPASSSGTPSFSSSSCILRAANLEQSFPPWPSYTPNTPTSSVK
mmetsp:Transcript_134692/g.336090  ORF Transcript_134692/g.336090 Transcript_134692/m.336090 type:complete len:238 (-) Transcript_134692:151-864(-)